MRLGFSTYAMNKLQYMCHIGDTEVAGFGITSEENPLFVHDIRLLPQTATAASFEFDKDGYANYAEDAAELEGHSPDTHLRIWIHTHPGDSPTPSGTDMNTLSKEFGNFPWLVMYILARGGRDYAKLRMRTHQNAQNVCPAVEMDLDTYTKWGDSSLDNVDMTTRIREWKQEYETNVKKFVYQSVAPVEKHKHFARYGGTFGGIKKHYQKDQPELEGLYGENLLEESGNGRRLYEEGLHDLGLEIDLTTGRLTDTGGKLADRSNLDDINRMYESEYWDEEEWKRRMGTDLSKVNDVDLDLANPDDWKEWNRRHPGKSYDEPIQLSGAEVDLDSIVVYTDPKKLDKLVDPRGSKDFDDVDARLDALEVGA